MSAAPPPSLNLIYDLVKGRIGEQNTQIAALDTKANFAVVSSTLLISGAGTMRSAVGSALQAGRVANLTVIGRDAGISLLTVSNALTTASLVTFLVLAWCAYKAYQLRRYTIVPNIGTLLDEYWDAPEVATKAAIVTILAEAFAENERLVTSKVRWTKAVLIGLMVQGGGLVLMAFVQFSL